MRETCVAVSFAAFQYDPPTITNVSPNRVNLTALGTLNVIIEGSSFCASQSCGYVLVNGAPPISTTRWTDSAVPGGAQIAVVVQDPGSTAQPQTVQVVVGGVASNIMTFVKPVPFFSGRAQVRKIVYRAQSRSCVLRSFTIDSLTRMRT